MDCKADPRTWVGSGSRAIREAPREGALGNPHEGRDGISCALYVVEQPKRVVVVRVFVKKTPRKELKLALKRAEEIT